MPSAPTRLHLIDGTFELFRAHYSKRPDHVLRNGRSRKAVVGMVSSLVTLLQDAEERVTHLAVAFDNPIRSFRNDLFPGYKSDDGVEPELRSQFDDAEIAVRALGVVAWSMKEFEADDAIATAASTFAKDFDEIRILSPDKDMAQCLDGKRVVQIDRIRETRVDEASFREKKGYAPKSVPDFLALVGDTADGIPGLDGFGEKSTAQLLAHFGSLERIPDDPDEWAKAGIRGAAKLAATLAAGREDAELYRTLATLRRDAPLTPGTKTALAWKGVPSPDFQSWAEAMELGDSLRARIAKLERRSP